MYNHKAIKKNDELYNLNIFSESFCNMCKTCEYGKEYKEESNSFSFLRKKLGRFFRCRNKDFKKQNMQKYNCFYYLLK